MLFVKKIESLVSSDNRDNVYVELPHLNLETIIAKNSEIHQYIDENFERQKNILMLIMIQFIILIYTKKQISLISNLRLLLKRKSIIL